MWLRSRAKAWSRTSVRPRPHCYRPRLEALEDRFLPSAGLLDPTFGAAGAGLITSGTSAINNSSNQGLGQRVLIRPDGKLLALGGSLVQYNTDSSLDTSFGSGGIANFGGNSVALQSDGKVLLAGGGGSAGFSLTRLNSNGWLDTSFGNQGTVTTSFSSTAFAEQIVVQPNGEIDLAGGADVQNGKYLAAFDLARYNTDGSLDTSFGRRGTVVTSFSKSLPGDHLSVQALLLQANGDLIVVAHVDIYAPSEWLLARYNPNGNLDTSFGNQGIVTIPSGSNQIGSAWVGGALLYPNAGTANDGKIVVVGDNASPSSGPGPVMARFNTNGSLDTTFGNGGFVPLAMTPFGSAFDSSGRFVVAGMNDLSLERLNSDGTPDTTFGSGGAVTAGLSGTHGDGLAIYPSTGTDTADFGKVLVVGATGSLAGNGFMVTRFLPSAPPSAPSFVVTGSASTTAGAPLSITVTATDANGNVLTNYTGTIDFADFTNLDARAVLPANYTFTAADQGVHTFTATYIKALTQAVFVADTATPAMNGRLVNLQVKPGPVAQIILEDAPTSIQSGTAFSMYLGAVDAYGNATTFNDTVHFSSSDPNATLPSDETVSNGQNLGTFILRTKGTQTITITDVTDPSLTFTITIQVT
jgi:uncharacterized delta-60 repeat protein